MERIKIHTNNARDRMEIMQKRYHEYQDSLKTGDTNVHLNRASLNASPFEVCMTFNSYQMNFSFVTKMWKIDFFPGANLWFIVCFACAIDTLLSLSSELILIIEIQRIDLIHLAHDLDLAAFQVLLVHLRMATLVLIKIPMILI